MKLSIIIPVFNERETILELLNKVESADLGEAAKEIIIVEDCSTDGTRELLAGMEAKHKIIYHDKNYGKGRALRTGFALAAGEIIVVQDADLEYDPNDFKPMLAKMAEPGAQVVYGSRVGHENYFKIRKSGHVFALGGLFLTWLVNFLYGTKITDEPTCYKMFKAELLPALNLKCERFEFCPEFTAKVAKKGIKIHEVPISYNPRRKNEGKKIKFKDGLEAIAVLIKNRFKRET